MLKIVLAICLLAAPAVAAQPSPPDACRGKTTCEQMESCEEAYFYYKRCGTADLDRDADGIPCENLCR